MGLPKAPDEEICQTIGLSLPKTFQNLIENHHEYSVQEFDDLFMHRAEQVMADRTVLFPSVQPTLHALKSFNIDLGIVSTKSRRRIVAILEREGLLDPFSFILGGGDVPIQKPDPAGIIFKSLLV